MPRPTASPRDIAGLGWGRRAVVLAGGIALVFAYVRAYLANPTRPGNEVRFPLGWLGFHDQGLYWQSARALATGDLAAAHHWYPLGYALVVAPFTRVLPFHAFAIPDALALLVTYGAFVSFARRVGIGSLLAVSAFLVATLSRQVLLEMWVVPWTTTLSAALIWGLLAMSAASLADARPMRQRWPLLCGEGIVAGAIPLVRPADLLLVAICGACLLAAEWRRPRRDRALLAMVLASGLGVVLPVLPYAVLHLLIYGPHPTRYMAVSDKLGFRFGALPWKLHTLLIEPRPWYPDGRGLVERLTWLLLGLAGIVLLPALPRGPQRASLGMLAVMMIATVVLFAAYVDLLPSGLWLYGNVHYFKWTFPGFALFAAVLLRRLALDCSRSGRPMRWAAPLAIATVVLSTMPRPVPVPVAPGEPAWMLHYSMTPPGWLEAYFGEETVADRNGTLRNIIDMRALPDQTGLRVIAQARPFDGTVSWVSRNLLTGSGVPAHPDAAWRLEWRLGWPCWLPPHACRREKLFGQSRRQIP